MSEEVRYEIIVREHRIERGKTGDRPSTKSRRYDIYKRVFDSRFTDQVLASVERTLNKAIDIDTESSDE